jgi:hypothetical protein
MATLLTEQFRYSLTASITDLKTAQSLSRDFAILPGFFGASGHTYISTLMLAPFFEGINLAGT